MTHRRESCGRVFDSRARGRRQRGGALVEVAVAIPLLMLILVGLVDFGRAASEAINVENAARAGASYGARNVGLAADAAGIQGAALADLSQDVDPLAVTVVSERYCECSNGQSVQCSNKCSGQLPQMYLRVRVDKQFQTLLNYPGVPDQINLSREVRLRVR
jgi:Flp pilus assembly protein TadG